MDERIKFFVGLDAHKDSIAVAACEAGREPARFVGTMGPDVNGLFKLLAKAGDPAQLSPGQRGQVLLFAWSRSTWVATIRLTRDTDKPTSRAMALRLWPPSRCARAMPSSRLRPPLRYCATVPARVLRCALGISRALRFAGSSPACMRCTNDSSPR